MGIVEAVFARHLLGGLGDVVAARPRRGGGPLVLGNVGVGDVAHVVVQATDLLDVDHRGIAVDVGDFPRVFEGVVGGLPDRDAAGGLVIPNEIPKRININSIASDV